MANESLSLVQQKPLVKKKKKKEDEGGEISSAYGFSLCKCPHENMNGSVSLSSLSGQS